MTVFYMLNYIDTDNQLETIVDGLQEKAVIQILPYVSKLKIFKPRILKRYAETYTPVVLGIVTDICELLQTMLDSSYLYQSLNAQHIGSDT